MKIVIFAAGEGVRMRPLTEKTPKPLLSYRGRANLDYLFNLLPSEIDEAIITVRHLAEKIKEHCGESFYGRKIHYVDGAAEGNALGFMSARSFFAPGERFAVAYGDEVFAGDEIERCLKHTYAWICYEVADPTKVGIVTIDDGGKIVDLTEKPEKPISNLAADGFMVINTDIFDYQLKKHQNGEYYFSDLMGQFIKNHDVFAVMGSPGHCQLTSPADLERLNQNK